MKQKQKIDINAIMKQFDQYVQVSLNKKSSDQEPQANMNELDLYYQSMQKRLKIRAVTNDEKFQNMLGPMKKLKSFVSIKDFLRGINQKPTKEQIAPVKSLNTKRKLQYEDLRGGLYMQKVENYLRKNNMKRKLDNQAQILLKQLQENQVQKNQYRTWMQNVLGKINMKQQCFLRQTQFKDQQEQFKQNQEQSIFKQLTNNQTQKSIKKENQKRRISQQQEQKNFKKVSNFLSQRLRKILTDKYVNNSSKKTQRNKNIIPEDSYGENLRFVTQQPSSFLPTYRKTVCRTTVTSKRMRQSVKNPNFRAQTSQVQKRKPCEDIWKRNVNNKMNDILSVANQEFQRCIEQKKQLKALKQSRNTVKKRIIQQNNTVSNNFPIQICLQIQ